MKSRFSKDKNTDIDSNLGRMKKIRLLWIGLIIAIGIVAVVALGAEIDHAVSLSESADSEYSQQESLESETDISSLSADNSAGGILEEETESEKQYETESEYIDENYVSPIDFETIWKQNPDVIAWLTIPGTNIDYPILQHKEDDTYYLTHGIDGEKNKNGELFTEAKYNSPSFSDPVTVVYGHNMASGEMFGLLQENFSQGFKGRGEAILYLPDREIHYQLFAALPVGAGHLLYGKDMTDDSTYSNFAVKLLNSSSFDAEILDDTEIGIGERLLVLSTCIGHEPDKRFIVVGKETGGTKRFAEEDVISLDKINLGKLLNELGLIEESETEETEEDEAVEVIGSGVSRILQKTDVIDSSANSRVQEEDTFVWEPDADGDELGACDVASPKTGDAIGWRQ